MRTFSIFCFAMLFLVACKPDQDQNDLIQSGSTPSEDPNGDSIEVALADRNDLPFENNENETDTLRYLALGDSYTIGESVAPEERWPNQLVEKINSEQDNVHISSAQIIAQTGWTTANLSNAMDQQNVDSQQYDLVSLLIGVNNQYQGQPLSLYQAEFPVLLQRAIDLVGGDASKVFVVSIPDYGYTPFGSGNQANISASLAQFNAACQEMTTAAGVAHYNITPISQQYPGTSGLVAADGLHPSGYQYQLWVSSFWEDVLGQLE